MPINVSTGRVPTNLNEAFRAREDKRRFAREQALKEEQARRQAQQWAAEFGQRQTEAARSDMARRAELQMRAQGQAADSQFKMQDAMLEREKLNATLQQRAQEMQLANEAKIAMQEFRNRQLEAQKARNEALGQLKGQEAAAREERHLRDRHFKDLEVLEKRFSDAQNAVANKKVPAANILEKMGVQEAFSKAAQEHAVLRETDPAGAARKMREFLGVMAEQGNLPEAQAQQFVPEGQPFDIVEKAGRQFLVTRDGRVSPLEQGFEGAGVQGAQPGAAPPMPQQPQSGLDLLRSKIDELGTQQRRFTPVGQKLYQKYRRALQSLSNPSYAGKQAEEGARAVLDDIQSSSIQSEIQPEGSMPGDVIQDEYTGVLMKVGADGAPVFHSYPTPQAAQQHLGATTARSNDGRYLFAYDPRNSKWNVLTKPSDAGKSPQEVQQEMQLKLSEAQQNAAMKQQELQANLAAKQQENQIAQDAMRQEAAVKAQTAQIGMQVKAAEAQQNLQLGAVKAQQDLAISKAQAEQKAAMGGAPAAGQQKPASQPAKQPQETQQPAEGERKVSPTGRVFVRVAGGWKEEQPQQAQQPTEPQPFQFHGFGGI